LHKSKTTAQSITALVILALIAVAVQPQLASANYYPPPSIEIFSPITPAIYNESSVRLYVRVNALPSESSSITRISYCLDGKANVTLTDIGRENDLYYWTSTKGVIARGNGFSVNTTLDNLAEGNHTLIVYSHAVDGTEMSRSVEFTVDYDYVPPENPFGLPDNFPNGTTGLPPATSQTETTLPTINTGSLQPLEGSVPYIIIACILVALLVGVLFFRKKYRREKGELS
jgi:hypothetical protein